MCKVGLNTPLEGRSDLPCPPQVNAPFAANLGRTGHSPSTGRQQAGRAASPNRTLVAPAPAGRRQLPRSFEREAGAVLLVRWKKPVPYPGASISLVRYAPG